ncbi:MAG TPA: hypothetical protein DDZ76_00705 [Xanthomonadales bacterium]|nr:hypothetical protein [Xanthomonadales bacterium]
MKNELTRALAASLCTTVATIGIVPSALGQTLPDRSTLSATRLMADADAPETPDGDYTRPVLTDATTRPVLDPIVVVATRTERPRFTTPAAISTISAEQIETLQPYGFQDVFEAVPGVAVQGGPRRIAEEPAIRGFDDERVAIRIDGTRQNFNKAHGGRFLLDPDLIQSVEVLRGAGSAVYGSGALGGVFDIRTRSGRDFSGGIDGLGGRVRAGWQDNGQEWRVSGLLHGQRNDWDGLVALGRRELGEDLRDGDDNRILASRDRLAWASARFGWQPGEDQRFELAFDHFDNQGINPSNANAVAEAGTLVDRDSTRRQVRASYRLAPEGVDWLDLRATVHRNVVDTDEFRLDDDRQDRSDFATNGLELVNSSRLAGDDRRAVVLTYGVEAYADRQRGQRNGAARPQFPDASARYQAAFAQLELPIGSRLSLIPGLRWDRFEYDSAGGFADRDDDRLSGRVAAGIELAADWYAWADWSRAFRAPSLTELFADGVHFTVPLAPGQIVINRFVPSPDLAAERLEQVQAGLRWRHHGLLQADDRVQVDLVYFRSDVDDFVDQVVTFISGPPRFDPPTRTLVFPGITRNLNVDAVLTGAELEARYDAERWYAQATLSLLDSRRRGEDVGLASVQPDRLRLVLGTRWLQRSLTLGVGLTAARSRRDVPAEALTTPGHGEVDVTLGWRPQQGALAGFGFDLALDNAFDTGFRLHPNPVSQPGRSLRLSVSRDFSL